MYRIDFFNKIPEKFKINGEFIFIYPEARFFKSREKIDIYCKKHGIFKCTVSNHLKGRGCPKCAGKNKTTTEWILKAQNIHDNKYDYSLINYKHSEDIGVIICPKHGKFEQLLHNHLRGRGCPKCNNEPKYTTNEWILKAKKVHGNKYFYGYAEYLGSKEFVTIDCIEHGLFYQRANNHLNGQGCPKCSHGNISSKAENEIISFLQNYINEIEQTNKFIISPKTIDIYIPSKKVAIEFNGTYWHSEIYRNKDYHYQKSLECSNKNIRLIHVWEWMWNDERKQKILKNIILSACGLIEHKIYARKCKSEIIDLHTCSKEQKQEIIDFFNNNNINGYRGAKYCCLLRHNEEIVHSFTFGYPFQGNNKYEYELIRGASKLGYSIIGGSSKLWSLFIKEINPESVVYYVDYNYFDGKSLKYLKPEFKYISHSLSFWNYNKQTGEVKNRQPMRNKELTNNLNIFKIYGAGTKTYVYNK